MIGQTISHYRILEKIGEGGMGIVYRAEDRRLKRTVALKFLHEDAFGDEHQRGRFIREAQTAAALDHPNICTIYEIDERSHQIFISMSYIEGVSLRDKLEAGPLSIEDVVHTLSEVATGLEAAHNKNIYHCDINLTNIMVTSDGQTKIMDFGLATIVGATDLKTPGKTFGTMAYMSPEQIRGDAVDQRTDIWSLGVCAYEMLCGRLPFTGDYGPAVFYSILNEEPMPVSARRPDVPVELGRIVHKAMSKAPGDRYSSIGELLSDLNSITKQPSAARGAEPAVAVLPFTNMSADRDQEYFCDGIAEDIINGLTQVTGLRVVARTSAFAFKGMAEDIREIGRKLGVDVVLEGSVRKWGDKLRITAQLVSVKDGYHLWSNRFDRLMEDVFAIQDEISQAIVDMLKIELVGKQQKFRVKRYTSNFDAYSFYLKGRYHWNKRSEEGLKKGLECFERAIERDDRYALAFAGLADSYNLLGFYGSLAPSQAFPKAEEAVVRAMDIDDTIAEAHASLGFAKMFYDWDWTGAAREFEHAIELVPNYPTAHHWYAEHLVLTGRMDAAKARSKKALESDPLSLIINTLLGWIPHYGHDYGEAVDQYRKTLEMDSRFVPAHFFLGLTYVQTAMYREAVTEFQEAAALFGGSGLFTAAEAYARARAGQADDATRILESLGARATEQFVPPYYVAAAYLALGDEARAFADLDRACEQRDIWLAFLKVDPIWDAVRSDPRFDALIGRIGFPQ